MINDVLRAIFLTNHCLVLDHASLSVAHGRKRGPFDLRHRSSTAGPNYKTKDAGKVVMYSTTMGIVRETYYACMKVKQILRTHLVKYEERDMFMSSESQSELRDRIGSTIIQVPQLFIDGQYIGDAYRAKPKHSLNQCDKKWGHFQATPYP
ncbi:glutaredoxin domain-containing cysteine-rich protein CG31559-like [Belonocnema kinseyi]|uniref:glutaredoxin domain-containing cysteine-rich protein CG31559-like n=1 Tax=Belonocnema kinseyi TaxID=2817044 RepID=UPI00143D78E3|nr:glutaredoxin domain-containing cysteine-rich protein CG31559-like [Belonocnema kinseyi]